jgi:hypothetical protein
MLGLPGCDRLVDMEVPVGDEVAGICRTFGGVAALPTARQSAAPPVERDVSFDLGAGNDAFWGGLRDLGCCRGKIFRAE